MTRFFVSPEEMGESFLVLTGENAAHAKVLRLKTGDMVTVCDGQGRECNCTVSDVSPGQVSLVAHHWGNSQGEAVVPVRIFMAFPKADKLEHVIQKATELGATEIITFPTARCVSRPEERALEKKLDRWRKIAASAAEQSGRGRIPRVTVLPSYAAALAEAAKAELPILFYENEAGNTPFYGPGTETGFCLCQPGHRAGGRPGAGGGGPGQGKPAWKFAVWAAGSCDAKPPLCALWLR